MSQLQLCIPNKRGQGVVGCSEGLSLSFLSLCYHLCAQQNRAAGRLLDIVTWGAEWFVFEETGPLRWGTATMHQGQSNMVGWRNWTGSLWKYFYKVWTVAQREGSAVVMSQTNSIFVKGTVSLTRIICTLITVQQSFCPIILCHHKHSVFSHDNLRRARSIVLGQNSSILKFDTRTSYKSQSGDILEVQ